MNKYELLEDEILKDKGLSTDPDDQKEVLKQSGVDSGYLEDFCDDGIQECLNLLMIERLKDEQDPIHTYVEFGTDICKSFLEENIKPVLDFFHFENSLYDYHKKPVAVSLPLYESILEFYNPKHKPIDFFTICRKYNVTGKTKHKLMTEAYRLSEAVDIRDLIPSADSMHKNNFSCPCNADDDSVNEVKSQIPEVEDENEEIEKPDGRKIADIKKIIIIKAVPANNMQENDKPVEILETQALLTTGLFALSKVLSANKLFEDELFEEGRNMLADAFNFVSTQSKCCPNTKVYEYAELKDIMTNICVGAK